MSALPFPLSLQRVTGKQPVTYTNTERMQVHRLSTPVTFGNNHFPRSRVTANPFQGGAAPSTSKDRK